MTDRKSAHPDREQLEAFGAGRLGLDQLAEVESHVAACDSCCQVVRSVEPDDFVALLRACIGPPRPTSDREAVASTLEGGAEDVGPVGLAIPSSFVLPGRSPTSPLSPEAAPSPTSAAPAPPAPAFLPEVPEALAQHPRYRIVRWLGSGGMGAVYLAEHRLMQRTVALKVIDRDLTDQAGLVERFRREVRAAARLAHPNIVAAHDAEQAGPVHFLVMEYVDGADLAKLVARRGPLPVAPACNCVRQAALGLQHAHEHGMVHRDIKPQNLMLTPCGRVKVLDFGLAIFAGEGGPDLAVTSAGTVLGTADYIAPEQADDSHTADIRADIYSLGCTLYFLLAGHPPFPGGSLMQKLKAHSRRNPKSLGTIRTDLPHGLDRVLERMMAKDPKRRHQTPAEVAQALAPFVQASTTAATAEMTPRPRPVEGSILTRLDITVDRSPEAWKPDAADFGPSALDEPGPIPLTRRLLPPAVAAVALLLFSVGLFALAIYRIRTDKGELIIETEDANVEVFIKQGGGLVTIIDPETDQTIELRSGDYQVALNGKPKGFQLSPSTFTLKRGEREVVRVRRVRPVAPATIDDRERSPTEPVGEVRRFAGHTSLVFGVAFAPDGRRALSCGDDRTVRQWDLGTGRESWRHDYDGLDPRLRDVAIAPDGRRALVGAHDHTARLLDMATGREIRRFVGHKAYVQGVAFSSDGRLALTAGGGWGQYEFLDNSVRLWDVDTGRELRRFEGHTLWVRTAIFSPDDHLVLSSSLDRTLRLWDARTGTELRRFEGHTGGLLSAVFTPDGRRALSSSSDKTIRLWDVDTGRELRRFEGHSGPVATVVVSSDGRRALSASEDGTVRLWDVDTGREVYRCVGHTGSVLAAVLSPDGRYAFSGGADHTVRLWRLPDPPPP